jgi:nucleoside-diphosphate-sugar epimerase
MNDLLLLGVGDTAQALVAGLPSGRTVVGTTRDPARFPALAALGVRPLRFENSPGFFAELAEHAAGADVLVSFPPDAAVDGQVAFACRGARALVYVSSTGVYGRHAGRVDHLTEPSPDGPVAAARLAAETTYRAVGGRVLRAPALYGLTAGLHVRLRAGTYRLPGDGSGVVSRVHLDDLARFVVAALERGEPGRVYLVGDEEPAPNRDVVAFVCQALGLPLPPSVPLAEAPATLRGSRSIDASAAREALGVTLGFPTYREGYGAIAEALLATPTVATSPR